MGINTITRGIVTLFLIGIIFLALMPYVFNLSVDQNLWGNITDSRALFLRDNAMLVFYVSGLIGFITTIIWMFNASANKGGIGTY